MKEKLSDFGALKSLKKKMEKDESSSVAFSGRESLSDTGASSEKSVPFNTRFSSGIGPSSAKKVQQKTKARIIQKKSVDEEHARNEGISRGQKVRMMDSNDCGTIVGFGKGFYEIEIDGLTIRATKPEFILVNAEDDRRIYSSIPSKPLKKGEPEIASRNNEDCTIDLHFERIPGNENVPDWAALDYQLDYFRRILRSNLKYRGKHITFIHGDGDGTLRKAIRKELDEVFSVSCTYASGPSETFGTGATIVTIR